MNYYVVTINSLSNSDPEITRNHLQILHTVLLLDTYNIKRRRLRFTDFADLHAKVFQFQRKQVCDATTMDN